MDVGWTQGVSLDLDPSPSQLRGLGERCELPQHMLPTIPWPLPRKVSSGFKTFHPIIGKSLLENEDERLWSMIWEECVHKNVSWCPCGWTGERWNKGRFQYVLAVLTHHVGQFNNEWGEVRAHTFYPLMEFNEDNTLPVSSHTKGKWYVSCINKLYPGSKYYCKFDVYLVVYI